MGRTILFNRLALTASEPEILAGYQICPRAVRVDWLEVRVPSLK